MATFTLLFYMLNSVRLLFFIFIITMVFQHQHQMD